MYSGFCYIGEPWLLEQYIFNKMTWICYLLEIAHSSSLNPFNSTMSETFTNLGNCRFTSSNAFLRRTFSADFFPQPKSKPITERWNRHCSSLICSIESLLSSPHGLHLGPHGGALELRLGLYNELYNELYDKLHDKRSYDKLLYDKLLYDKPLYCKLVENELLHDQSLYDKLLYEKPILNLPLKLIDNVEPVVHFNF